MWAVVFVHYLFSIGLFIQLSSLWNLTPNAGEIATVKFLK